MWGRRPPPGTIPEEGDWKLGRRPLRKAIGTEAAAPIAMLCASPCHGGNEEVPGMEVGMQRTREDRGRGRPTHNGCRSALDGKGNMRQ